MFRQAMSGDMQQMGNKIKGINNEMKTNAQQMNNKMDTNAQKMENKMDENMQTLRGEMRRIGQSLQAGTKGIMAIARSEAWTVECRMAAPRGGDPEPTRGSVNCVGPAMEAGEDKIRRETCWTRLVTTEKVTVTEREKLNGVTETWTRHGGDNKEDNGNKNTRDVGYRKSRGETTR